MNEGTIAGSGSRSTSPGPTSRRLHAERVGHLEGVGRVELLRYLRHETGHVVNYAYQLFETEEWVRLFGPMTRPYRDEYRAEPFSPRFVRHLPGWYAQKHPDEDWSETFAVWMTPGLDWHVEYGGWPEALAKLQYCDRTMAELADRDPLVTADDLDEDVSDLAVSVDDFYNENAWPGPTTFPESLDAALRSVFDPCVATGPAWEPASRPDPEARTGRSRPRSTTGPGHFPERTWVRSCTPGRARPTRPGDHLPARGENRWPRRPASRRSSPPWR